MDIQTPQAHKSIGGHRLGARYAKGQEVPVELCAFTALLIGMAIFKRQQHLPPAKTKQNKLRITGEENFEVEKIG